MMKSAKWVVCGVSDHQYQVSDGRYNRQVDFHTGTCQCRKWQLSGLPYGHDIAVTKYLGLTDCLQFVSDWFKKPKYQGTYAEPIHFIGNVQEWEFPQHIRKAIPPRMDNPQPGTYLRFKQRLAKFYYTIMEGSLVPPEEGLVPLADALQDRNMLLTYAQSHQNRLHVYVSRVEISPLVVADQHKDEENKKEKQGKPSYMISHLTRKISRRFTTLYYTLPPNNTLPGLEQIKNDYDTNVMYDTSKVSGKIQLFVSHHQIDLSTVLIPNDGSLEEAFAGFINKTIPTTPYTQTNFNFVVYNNGQLVLDNTKDTTYINGGTMNINILRMKLEELKQYLSNILAHYKLQIYIDHLGVDFIIAKYIFPNASLAEMMNHVITNYTSDSEDNKREVTQNDYTFNQMVEWAEQEHFEDEETKLSCPKIDLSTSMADSANDARKTIVSNLQRELEAEATLANTMLGNLTRYFEQMRIREIQITMLQNMPTMSLNSYGLHALLMTHEADIRTTNNLIRARQELLRSIAEKQNFINNYRAI
ncbi:hypothetical protein Tco_0969815 [Tanacetum coccineum]